MGDLWRRGEPVFAGAGWGLSLWLLLSGVVTVIPMLFFAMGARRLPLGTLGFLQYIEPSLSFLVAVFIFGEPFGRDQAAIFGLIWPALALFSVDLIRHSRAQRNATAIHSP
jgi:chloramphenicol-sensitive protein RarD